MDKFRIYLNYASSISSKSKISIIYDILKSSYHYNISVLDYFYFRFFEKNIEEREKWAGTGFMYEYQLKMNPKKSRSILENKIEFLEAYSDFIIRKWTTIQSTTPDHINKILNNAFGKVVAKGSTGQVGAEVHVLESVKYNSTTLKQFMVENNLDLLEECVMQHSELMRLSPSGLNTVRVFTQLNAENEVIILGARLRVTVNSAIDNLAAGNFACVIDAETGLVVSDGVYSDITKEDVIRHPVTGVEIKGFKVPKWHEVLHMVKSAALLHPVNRSIGWDIAIRDHGIELIEGNHNWCKLLYQLPLKQGLKNDLLPYVK